MERSRRQRGYKGLPTRPCSSDDVGASNVTKVKMETTFYDDSQYRSKEEIKMLKRTMTLDLDSPKNTKKQKISSLLSSPDLNMLKLASPELEKLIIAHNGLVTTTPTPTQFMFPKTVTEEQEQYARGFVDALAQLHQATAPSAGSVIPQPVISTDASSGASTTGVTTTTSCTVLSFASMPSDVATSNSSDSFVTIKEEPHTVLSEDSTTPPMSPINMENQEKIKLERKRERNRIAASKCRRRKLERISRLEDKVSALKGENTELSVVVSKLRDQICQLKQQVMDHVKSGCDIMTHKF